jgi:ABC-type amino acid transport substrate-binding protein
MDVDFCRAVAAAMGPAVRVEFLPLTASARFVALKMGRSTCCPEMQRGR